MDEEHHPDKDHIMDIAGKVFVVTGGGNGIARELVLQLLAKGATVAAVDLNSDGLKETAKLAGKGAKLSTHTLNITDRAKVMALPKAVITKHGQVDALVNVAGIIQPFVKVNDLDECTVAANAAYECQFGSLVAGKTYAVQIIARNLYGLSSASLASHAVPAPPAPPAPAPTGISASAKPVAS